VATDSLIAAVLALRCSIWLRIIPLSVSRACTRRAVSSQRKRRWVFALRATAARRAAAGAGGFEGEGLPYLYGPELVDEKVHVDRDQADVVG